MTLTLAMIAAPFAFAGSLDCTALFRTLDRADRTVEKTAPLVAKGPLLEATLAGRTFRVREEDGSLFAQIFEPRDSAKGISLRGTPDSEGRFSAASVDGPAVHRLDCRRF